jgi:hypothetical protein
VAPALRLARKVSSLASLPLRHLLPTCRLCRLLLQSPRDVTPWISCMGRGPQFQEPGWIMWVQGSLGCIDTAHSPHAVKLEVHLQGKAHSTRAHTETAPSTRVPSLLCTDSAQRCVHTGGLKWEPHVQWGTPPPHTRSSCVHSHPSRPAFRIRSLQSVCRVYTECTHQNCRHVLKHTVCPRARVTPLCAGTHICAHGAHVYCIFLEL